MEKSKILWITIILNLFISQSISDQQICRRSDNCQCFNNSDHYEYQCSENQKEEEEEVILHVYPDSLIKIDCSNVEVLNKQKLPSVKFEDIEKLQIRYCPLPENGLKEIVQHFGMKNLDMLSFEFGVFDDFKLETEKFINLPNVTVLRLRGNDLKSIGDNFLTIFPN
ncbi:hypothetical protein HHI36_017269 [Cryptolaemus montrouzieri]|uniref:Uncharacterized protein n=1 Tax=Cryptolaemus montrouzieri TaxID=559131 RepID=A0ABD2NN16_9CUCU